MKKLVKKAAAKTLVKKVAAKTSVKKAVAKPAKTCKKLGDK